MITVFLKVMMIFAIVAVGFIANRTGVLPYESNKYLVDLLLTITTPCMVLASISSNELNDSMITTTLQIIIGTLLFFLAVCILSWIIVKWMKYDPLEDWGVLMVTMCAINTGFMGFPVTKAIFGNEFLYYMVIENILCGVYLYFIVAIQMNYGNRKRGNFMDMVRSLCNINMLACVLGIILVFTRIKMPSMLHEFFDMVGAATVPISMIVVGIQLGESKMTRILKNRKLVIACVVNVVVVPLLTFLAVYWLPLITWQTKVILIFAAAFPCAVIPVAIASKEQKNATLMAEGVGLTTLMSIVTLPLWAMFLTKLYF